MSFAEIEASRVVLTGSFSLEQEQLRRLPIALNGTSVDRLRRSMLEGRLIPTDTSGKGHSAQYADLGAYSLYFATPIILNLILTNSDFANDSIELCRSNGSLENLDIATVVYTSASYARNRAITDYWYRRTNIFYDDLEYLALIAKKILDKDQLEQFTENFEDAPYYPQKQTSARRRQVQSVMDMYPGEKQAELREILIEASKRRGVILAYGPDFLAAGTPYLGREDSTEIFVASDQPVSTDVIVGVQFLSEEDRADFLEIHPLE